MRRPAAHRSRSSAPYVRIAAALEEEIRRRHRPGEKLPSEQRLADRFGVNRHTLRRAVDELVRAGLIQRRWGVGIFVAAQPLLAVDADKSRRLTERLESMGKTANVRVIAQTEIPAPHHIADELRIEAGAPLIQVTVLPESAAHPPFMLTHHLSAGRFPEFRALFDGSPVHTCLEACFGVQTRLERSVITVAVPDAQDVRRLALPDGQPLLLAQSIFTDIKRGEPVDYVDTRFRADQVQLEICWPPIRPSYTHF